MSDQCPEAHSAGPFPGTLWPRLTLPLTGEMSLEQQMLLPVAGDAIAISWRLIGAALLPARLQVSSLFLGDQPFSAAGFDVESETNGGRLA